MSATPPNGLFRHGLAFVLDQEGGYVENPEDPGGATNMGITLGTLSNWRQGAVSATDVRNLTTDEAADIYRKNYWDACRCDKLPSALALIVFDAAVNSGPRRAIMFLQSALDVPADGICGPTTIAAARVCNVPSAVRQAVATRQAFLQQLPSWNIFAAGWSARCEAVQEAALALAREE